MEQGSVAWFRQGIGFDDHPCPLILKTTQNVVLSDLVPVTWLGRQFLPANAAEDVASGHKPNLNFKPKSSLRGF